MENRDLGGRSGGSNVYVQEPHSGGIIMGQGLESTSKSEDSKYSEEEKEERTEATTNPINRDLEKAPLKFDEGKLLYNLLPVEVHEQIIERFTCGAMKYGEEEDGVPNWRRKGGHKPHKLLNAAYRHLAEYRKGIKNDDDPLFEGKKSPHLVAAINNLIMLQDLENIEAKKRKVDENY